MTRCPHLPRFIRSRSIEFSSLTNLPFSSLFRISYTVGYEVPEVEWMYPMEGTTVGGDTLTLRGSNLAEVRFISGVLVECKVDGVPLPPTKRGGYTWSSR